jgi:diguanylate cyclase (GGDEF)-like protein/PAS domain S-box-containing protein
MRLRGTIPLIGTLVMVVAIAFAAVQSSNRLITEAEGMRVQDRVTLARAYANTLDKAIDQIFQGWAAQMAAARLTGAPGSPVDAAYVERWTTISLGQQALAVLDGHGAVTVSGGAAVPPSTDPGFGAVRAAVASGSPTMSPVMFAGRIPVLAVVVPITPGNGANGAVAYFLNLTQAQTFQFFTTIFTSTTTRGERASYLLFDRNRVVVSSPLVSQIGTRLPDVAGYRQATAPSVGHVEFADNGARMVLIHAPLGTTGLSAAFLQGASAFHGGIRAQHQRNNLMVFGLMAFAGIVVAVVSLRRQRSVHRSEERLAALFQNAADVVAVVRDGSTTFVSASVERMTGQTSAGLVGRPPADLLFDDEARDGYDELMRFAADHPGRPSEVELSMTGRDGERRWADVTAVDLSHDRSVEGVVLTLHDVTERRALEAEVAHRALHDSLTDLANRSLFGDRLAHGIRRLDRHDRALALLFLDLDGFKPVNDELGHAAGDAVLKEVANRLRNEARAGDTVARLGGDEFAVLAEDLEGPDEARAVAERLLAAIGAPIDVGGQSVTVGASIGVAVAQDARADPETMLRNADLAMYAAKDGGKSRVELYGRHLAEDRSTLQAG